MQFSRQVYPFPANPPTATGVLLTGDDCDEIAFSVEYNVVPKDIVEFVLEPGCNQNNELVTWWKKISIPVIGNGEIGLERTGRAFHNEVGGICHYRQEQTDWFWKGQGIWCA